MSFDKKMKDDFGPVRQATDEEIKQETLLRRSRRNIKKPADLSLEAAAIQLKKAKPDKIAKEVSMDSGSTKSSPESKTPVISRTRKLRLVGQDKLRQYLEEVLVDSESNKSSPESKTPVISSKRKLRLVGQDKLRQYLEEVSADSESKSSHDSKTPAVSRKRKLIVVGQDKLRKYLKEKEQEKLSRKFESGQEDENVRITKAPKRRKLMLKPMDEVQKEKILAKVNASRKLMLKPMSEAQKEKILGRLNADAKIQGSEQEVSKSSNVLKGDQDGETNSDSELFIASSDCSDSEYVDALEVISEISADSPNSLKCSDTPKSSKVSETLEASESPKNRESTDISNGTEYSESKMVSDDPVEQDLEAATRTQPESSPETSRESTSTVSEEDVAKMRKIILSQLNGNKPVPMEKTCLEEPFKEICALFNSTVLDSESHTVLLTGAPGSGKTEIVEQALTKLYTHNAGKYIVIRLSGTLHFTDQHAIREIARQLDYKLKDHTEDLGEDTYEQREINETFHNILITLFKLDDPNEPEDKKESPIRVIFIIDEMEKFTANPRQTLLYNLFELAQISKVPICIVGVTPRVTLREVFEKRVRSRFSQRMIQTKRAETLDSFWQDAKLALLVPETNFTLFANEEYPKEWNQRMEKLLESHSKLTTLIARTFYTTKSYRQVHNECALPVSQITTTSPFPISQSFGMYAQNAVRGIEAIVASLSRAELLVVIAAARWITKADVPHVNFKLAFNEYTGMIKADDIETTTLSSKTSYIDNLSLTGIKITRNAYSAKMLRGCWRVVYRTGLLFDIISANNETNASNNANIYKEAMIEDSKMLQLDVSLEELGKLIPEGDYIKRFTRL